MLQEWVWLPMEISTPLVEEPGITAHPQASANYKCGPPWHPQNTFWTCGKTEALHPDSEVDFKGPFAGLLCG